MTDDSNFGADSVSGRCTILLLEDEPLILMDLELSAEDCGCRCLAATSVEQALAYLAEADPVPDLAVLDVTQHDGQTCLPVARELDRRGIPYILYSGDLDRHNEQIRTLDAELVAKPASADHVIAVALRRLRDRPSGKGAATAR